MIFLRLKSFSSYSKILYFSNIVFLMMTTHIDKTILKIGSKGEIFPPKEIRERLGLEPNQPILLYIHQDQLIVRKIHSIEEILNLPPKVKISYHAWKQFKDQLTEEYEQ